MQIIHENIFNYFYCTLLHGNLIILYLCATQQENNMAKPVGRPKDKDPKKNVPLRLRDSLRNKVQKAADKAERSLSYMLEKAIEKEYA